jgi:hypothetical protein
MDCETDLITTYEIGRVTYHLAHIESIILKGQT